jgi:hypothetical protein
MDSDRQTKFHRSVSVADIYRQTRSNQIASRAKASWKVKSSKFRALFHGAGIGTKTRYSREQSDWACAEVILFDRELNNAECATVERYLELKYGFKTTTDVTDGWKDQPIRIASAPNVCMDVAGGSKRNGGKIHA